MTKGICWLIFALFPFILFAPRAHPTVIGYVDLSRSGLLKLSGPLLIIKGFQEALFHIGLNDAGTAMHIVQLEIWWEPLP